MAIERMQDVPTLTQAGRGHAGADRAIRRARSGVTGSSGSLPGRHLVIASRMASGYHLNEFDRKHLQHVFTDWFPKAIYDDLTVETVRVDVTVRGSSIDRHVYTTAFLKDDGSMIKTIDYAEGRLITAKCPSYDPQRSGYCGTKDGVDFRLVTYNVNTR